MLRLSHVSLPVVTPSNASVGRTTIFIGRHPQLSGTPDDISLTSLAGPLPFAKNYFAWRPEKNMPCAGSGTEVHRWGSTPTATGSALVVGGRAGTNRTARASWANLANVM